jgi:DNA-binding MarR family transcriptional regulator
MPASVEAARWEDTFARLLGSGYAPARVADQEFDLSSADHATVIELKASMTGARDLNAALFRLASYAASNAGVQRAVLVARLPKLSASRAHDEWRRLTAMLRPSIMKKLALVALASDEDVILPAGDPELARLATAAREAARGTESRAAHHAWAPWSSRNYEVWKVLLGAWLRSEAPVAIQELARRSGASHPTISAVLSRLESTGELERTRSRAARLTGLPRASLAEILLLGDRLRSTVHYHDGSGRPPDAKRLLDRITKKAPPDVAVGGVAAARFYTPSFDLHGLPRVQLTIAQGASLEWLVQVDPALQRTPGLAGAPIPLLMVHRLARPEPSFEHDPATHTTFADPAEVLLDLYELRLAEQADDFVRTMRARKQTR